MPTWLRASALLLVLAWSVYRGARVERGVHARLVGAARGSPVRAVCVAVGYYVAILAVLALFGIVAVVAHALGPGRLWIIVLLAGLAVASPYVWCLGPGSPYGGPATSFGDLRKRGASKPVARGLAYTGVTMFFLTIAGPGTTAMSVLVIDR